MDDDFSTLMEAKSKEMFNLCDPENKGFITKRDMRKLSPFVSLNPEELDDVFDSLDVEGNGYLSFEEFNKRFGQYGGSGQNNGERSRYSSVMTDSRDEDYLEYEEEQFRHTMQHLGATDVIEDIDTVRELWARLRRDNPELLPTLETILRKMCSEINKSHYEFKNLEFVLKTKASAHDEEVRHLYEEMENQIKIEREKLIAEEKAKERQIRDELEQEIAEKDKQYHEIIGKYDETRRKLDDLKTVHTETAEEKEALERERDTLEKRMHNMEENLTECQTYIDELNRKTKEDRRTRAMATLEMTEGIAIERESLVREVQFLREINKKLKDEKDERLLMKQLAAVPRNSITLDDSQSFPTSNSSESRPSIPDIQTTRDTAMTSSLNTKSSREKRGSVMANYFLSPQNDSIEEDDDCLFLSNNGDVVDSPYSIGQSQTKTSTLLQQKRFSGNLLDSHIELDSCEENDVFHTSTGTATTNNNLRPSNLLSVKGQPISRDRPSPDGCHVCQDHSEQHSPYSNFSKSPERVYKVVFIGDSGVGKSSLIYRYCFEDFRSNFCATIGVDFQVKTTEVENNTVVLQLWDTAGQERFRSITRQYYRKADGIVITYDATSERTFCNVRQWIDNIEQETNADNRPVLLLLANKADLIDEGLAEVTKQQGLKLAEDYEALHFEVSAKTGYQVKEAFDTMASKLKKKEDTEICNAFKITESSVYTRKSGCCLK